MSSYLSLTQLETLPVQRVTDVVTEFVQNVPSCLHTGSKISFSLQQCKNFWNRLWFDKVIAKVRDYSFFGTQCTSHIMWISRICQLWPDATQRFTRCYGPFWRPLWTKWHSL